MMPLLARIAAATALIGLLSTSARGQDCAAIQDTIHELEAQKADVEKRLAQQHEELGRCRAASDAAPCPAAGTLTPTREGAWVLKEVRAFDSFAGTRATLKADGRGGKLTLEVPGSTLDLCAGGSETLEFSWEFDIDASALNPGETVKATLRGRPVSAAPPCSGGLASRAVLSMAANPVNPFVAPESLRIEGRFSWGTGNGRVFAAGGQTEDTGSVVFSTNPPDPKRPLAYFAFVAATPDGHATYVYLYEYAL
jgi:hypothetical protein